MNNEQKAQSLPSTSLVQNGVLAEVLINEKFLIVDNAPSLSKDIVTQLKQIFYINDLDFGKFKYDYVQATSAAAFSKISEHKNILVSTTFTTIKSNAVEDLINAGIEYGLKNKNVFSLMQFSNVGSDFEDYKPEVSKLAKNNVHFYFMSEGFTHFNLYE